MSDMRRLSFLDDDPAEGPVRTLFDLAPRDGAALRVGAVRLAPGQRVPDEGVSRHGVDEASLIVSGSLRGESGGEAFEIDEGDVTLIPAGEAHWAVAGDEGAEIFWAWFGDVAGEAGDAAPDDASDDALEGASNGGSAGAASAG